MKIGIMGGTFDPIHIGHLNIAKEAKNQFSLDEVWFIVAGDPPHKNKPIINRYHRYNMCKIALKNTNGFVLRDDEIVKQTPSYTYETLISINEKYPNNKLYFIMGEDSLNTFETWVNPKEIASQTEFLVAVRNDLDIDKRLNSINHNAINLSQKYNTNFHILKSDVIPASSTNIREFIKNKDYDKALEFVDKEVLEYAKTHRLYEELVDYDYDALTEILKTKISEKRFIHSLGVADTAAAIAARYNYPVQIAFVAGLLHDCAKSLTEEELLDYCVKNNIPISEDEKKSPKLLHAPVGSALAKNIYGIDDHDILDAIKTHTTGSANMSILQEIIYISDYIEPHRKRSKILSDLRHIAFFDRNLCIYMIAKDTIEFLKEKDESIDNSTNDTCNYYKSIISSK